MTKAQLEEKTNAELVEIIEQAGMQVVAKNPNKPTKKELIAVLIDDDAEPEIEERPKKASKKEMTPSELKKARKRYLTSRVRCIVRDLDDTTSKVDGIFVTWGNDEIGIQDPEPVMFNIETHIRIGALAKLKEQTFTEFSQDPGSNEVTRRTVKRYAIEQLPPLTEAEKKFLAESQQMRKGRGDLLK